MQRHNFARERSSRGRAVTVTVTGSGPASSPRSRCFVRSTAAPSGSDHVRFSPPAGP